MQLHFAIHHSANAFHEAMRLVVLLAAANDFVALCAGRHHERRLVNDLAAGIEFRNDEVARRAVGEHSARIGIVIRLNPGKAGQQAVMQINNPAAGVFPATGGGQNSHVSRENNEIDVVLVASAIIRSSSGLPFGLFADVEPGDFELFGQPAASVAIADHQSGVGFDLSVANGAEQSENRLGPIGDANRQRGRRPRYRATRCG